MISGMKWHHHLPDTTITCNQLFSYKQSPFLWTLPIWLLCFLAVDVDRHLHWVEGDVLAVKHFHCAQALD